MVIRIEVQHMRVMVWGRHTACKLGPEVCANAWMREDHIRAWEREGVWMAGKS